MRRLADRWWLVGAVLFAAVISVAWLLHRSEANREHAQQRAAQRQVVLVLGASVHDVLNREVALARVIGALGGPIGKRWPILANVVTGQSVASSAGFIVPVTERERAAFTRQTGIRLLESPAPGVVRPARARPLHLVAVDAWQTNGAASTLGIDLAANPLRRDLMLEAAKTGRQMVTPPVRFLGPHRGRYGVIAYAPVRDAQGHLQGWVTASYRAEPLASMVASQFPGVRLRIDDGGTLLFADLAHPAGAPSVVRVAERRWMVWVSLPGTGDFTTTWLVLGLGLCVAAAVTLILRQSATRERYAMRMLAQHDAEEIAINKIATLVAEQGSPEEVFALVAEEVSRLLDSRTAAVSRFEPDASHGTVVGSWTPQSDALTGATFALDGVTASAEVFRTGRPARVGGGYQSDLDPIAPLMQDLGGTGGIAAPIVVGGQLWGAIGAAYSTDSIPAGAEEGLGRFARLVSLAISNADAWDQLSRQASTDSLTGIANRRTFDARIASELERVKRYGRELSLVLLDIDYFKEVNDRHGHHAGDRVLVRLAQLLSENARKGDLVARIGGEEFAWLMPETDEAGAFRAADRLRDAFAREVFPQIGWVSVSGGVQAAKDTHTAADLIRGADQALYFAKASGRNQTFVRADVSGIASDREPS